jgi:hypothetical protein
MINLDGKSGVEATKSVYRTSNGRENSFPYTKSDE